MEPKLKTIAIVQARMGSTRLPNKVMRPISGVPMIELLLSRLSRSQEIHQIVVATSIDPKNELLAKHVRTLGYACEQGSENDVLERYVQAADKHGADIVVRITGDCPLVDSSIVDACVRGFKSSGADYFSNIQPPTFPDGLDVEVISAAVLKRCFVNTARKHDREHVTPYIRESGLFNIAGIQNKDDLSASRWTVDDPEDFQVVESIFTHFAPDIYFSWQQVFELQQNEPHLFEVNKRLCRNEGAKLGTGQKLWKRAKNVIPGGNMLLSKRAEMFLPNQWPSYFSKAKDCRVWDLDGREFIDMSIMGIGTNTLGYGHPEVDDAVRAVIDKGNMSTLNCPEEVQLAERLVQLHPWAAMARFARSGGEANAIAVRIARAASGRDKVAVCGYHGWHDWYLSANLADDKNLDGHLLPGLEPNGVPRNLKGTVFPFAYNRFDEFENIVRDHEIGVIKMEVSRNKGPEGGFLQKVRELATQKGIVLIFDECTSGFRQTFGGLHKLHGVEPDMAMFGKALGNGYAITATIGRRAVMEAAQSTFISSTFWTERIGPAAALKTLQIMERERSWEKITQTGETIRSGWSALAEKYRLEIEHFGLPALAGFSFKSPKRLEYKTLITQEMLKKGYLASNAIYACTSHQSEIVSSYFDALDPVFAMIADCENGANVEDFLEGPVCHAGFARLN
jgi:glutamate-1-semialdehyde 2,1-aminomutase